MHRFSILGLAVVLVVFFFWTEAGYRKVSKIGIGRLLRAFAWVTGVQFVLAAIAYLIPRMIL